MKRNMIIGCMMLGLLVYAPSVGAQAQYDYDLAYGYNGRDSGYRNAVAMDDWLERGRAAVTESPVFPDGIRLTAEGGEGTNEPGLASAIYYFTVPRGAQYLTISIRYTDAAKDDKIAGRLWIKSIDNDMRGEPGVGEEAPLYGDTFVLRSERSSETITVPTSRHVEGGTVEMHVVVEGTDCIDVRDIRVEYLYTRPQITVVRRTYSDYWHRWPRHRYTYHYYYWGPLFWPRTYVVYECWDVPTPFYWITWRPWFFVNIIRVHHHRPWWGPRRYTVVYHRDVKHPLIKRRHLLRTRLREHQVQVTRILHTNPVARTTDRTTPLRTHLPQGQEVRLKKEVQTPRTSETRVNQDPTPRHLKEQPMRANKARARPTVNTRTTTEKRPQVVGTPDARSADPSPTVTQRIHKDQTKPRAANQQPRSRSVNREKAVQAPVQNQLNKPGKVGPKADTEVKPAPIRRPNTEQLAQERKQLERLAVNKQAKTVKRPQVVGTPDSRSAHPSPTVTQRIHKDQQQPRAAKQQPRSRSVDRETVRETTRVRAAQDHRIKQEGAVQNHANIGQRNKPQSRQETRQPRPQARRR